MNIWPSLRWMKVLSQCWEGDVTMVLPSSYMQIKKSVTNPTKQDLQDACLQVICYFVVKTTASVLRHHAQQH